MPSLLAPAAVAACLFLLQTTLLAGLQLDLITPVLVYVALEASLTGAFLFAVAFGFLADTMTGALAGVNVALNLGVLAAARLMRGHLLLGSLPARVGAATVGLLFRAALFMALGALVRGLPPTGAMALAALVQVAGGAMISLPLFAALDRALELLALRQEPL